MNERNKLSILFNIEAGEGRLVMLLLIYSFLVGVSRLMVNTSASTLFRDRFGEQAAQLLPYVYIGAAIVAPLTGYLYSKLEERLGHRPRGFSWLMSANLSFLFIIIGLFYLLLLSLPQAQWPAMALYIGYYVFYALIFLSFWGLAGRLFDIRQSKRLFGLVGSGLVVAMILSGFAIRPLVDLIGTVNLLLVALAGIFGCLALMFYITSAYQPDQLPAKREDQTTKQEQRQADQKEYLDLFKSRYVVLMVALTTLNLLAYYFVDLAFYDQVYLRFPDNDELASFLGEFLAISSLLSLLSRTFVSGRLVSRYGVQVSLLSLPIVLILSVTLLVGVGTIYGLIPLIFWLVVVIRLLFRVMDDSIDKPAYSILYQALPTKLRLRVQTLIISIIEPAAGGVAGVLLLLLSFNTIQLSYAVLFILAAWVAAVIFLSRQYLQTLFEALTGRALGQVSLTVVDGSSMAILKQALKSPYPAVVTYALDMLQQARHESLARFLREALSHPEVEVRLNALHRVERLGLTSTLRSVNFTLRFDTSVAVQAAALRTIAAIGPADQLDEIAPYLEQANPQLRLGAMVGLLRSGGIEGILLAGEKLIRQVDAPDPAEREFAAQVLGEVGITNFYRPLLTLLYDDEAAVRRAALTAAGKLKNPILWPLVVEQTAGPEVRTAAVSALIAGGESTLPALKTSFVDPEQPPANLIRIARICGRIRGQGATALLQQQIGVPQNDVRLQVLKSLSLCHYWAQNEEIMLVQQQIKAEIDNATWILATLTGLSHLGAGNGSTQGNRQPDGSGSLLFQALTYELDQSEARVLLLLSFIYPRDMILAAQTNLTHGSKEKKAYALEVLDNAIGSHKLAGEALTAAETNAMVLPLFDHSLPLANRLERLREAFPQPDLDQNQHLQEIIRRSSQWISPWAKVCAIDSLARISGSKAGPALIPALSAPEPMVRESALWALSRLDQNRYLDQIVLLSQDANPHVARVARQLATGSQLLPAENGASLMLSVIEKVIILKSAGIFAETPEEILAEIAASLKEKVIKAGEAVFDKGDAGHHMYIIISGQVRVHDGEVTWATLGERDIFGELSVLDSEPRSASVTAIEETQLFRLDQDVLYELMADHVEVARGIIKVLTRRLRTLQGPIDSAQVSPAEKPAPTRKDVLLGGILEKLAGGD